MKRLSVIRFFYWLLFNIFWSIVQLVILIFTLFMRNIPIQMDPIIKDGVLFFFATALVGSACFDLWDAKRFPTEGFAAIFCVIVPVTVFLLTLITYPGMLADAFLQDLPKYPIDIHKLRVVEIAVTVLAILYSFIVKLLMIPRRQNHLAIEEG
ncbi:hypothetical protein FJZ31_20495 [Candidatus Poribacteria bacterium]|nr:hypothetical protein [Candidatus Poribacteria bacterium]